MAGLICLLLAPLNSALLSLLHDHTKSLLSMRSPMRMIHCRVEMPAISSNKLLLQMIIRTRPSSPCLRRNDLAFALRQHGSESQGLSRD
jgi:hypothetical protein